MEKTLKLSKYIKYIQNKLSFLVIPNLKNIRQTFMKNQFLRILKKPRYTRNLKSVISVQFM